MRCPVRATACSEGAKRGDEQPDDPPRFQSRCCGRKQLGGAFPRQSALEQRHADRQGHDALRGRGDGGDRPHRAAARGARRRSRPRSCMAGGVVGDGGPARRRRRQGRSARPPDHGGKQLHARRQLLLQRGTLHPARVRQDGHVSQGATLLPGGDGAPAPRDRTGRGTVRERQPAGLFRQGPRQRPPSRPSCCSTAWTMRRK